jgi:hypothetical protein
MKIANRTLQQIQPFLSHLQQKGWGFPNYPGIRTNKKKRHAETTHNICPSKPKYRSLRRYILRYIAHKCVTSVVTSYWVRGKQRPAASLRFAHATNLMPPGGLDHCRKARPDCSRNWLHLTGIRTTDYCKAIGQNGFNKKKTGGGNVILYVEKR